MRYIRTETLTSIQADELRNIGFVVYLTAFTPPWNEYDIFVENRP